MISLHFTRSVFAPLALSLVFLTALGSASTPARAADPAAEAWVSDVSEQAIRIISDKSMNKKAREAAFGDLLTARADMRKIAAFALGQFVRVPTAAQREEYINLFNNFVVKVYVTRLSDYHDEKLRITGSKPKGSNQALVESQIDFTTGREPVKVTWWLLKKDGSYKIFDINVVGIWLAQEQRSTFTSVINNNNGDFEALLVHLRKQIADADAGKLPVSAAAPGGTSNP